MESKLIQEQLKQYLTDDASTTSRYVVSVFLTFLSVLGTIGNATVLWVFWARRQQVVATLFIVILAAVDFSTCIIVMPFTIYMELNHFHIQLDAVCKLYQAFLIIRVIFTLAYSSILVTYGLSTLFSRHAAYLWTPCGHSNWN